MTKPTRTTNRLYFVSAVLLLTISGTSAAQISGSFQAEIIRDEFGVPYIIADTLPDAAFGDGYAQAEDRLSLLMQNILTVTGTRVAQLGAKEVNRDYKARLTGARRIR